MRREDIELVQQSWKTLRSIKPEIIGDVFYSKLFLDAPYVRTMFSTSVEAQSEKLISMLSLIVARMKDWENLKPDLQRLSQRHVHYGVQPVHYDLVGNALLWTLEKAIGLEWTKELETAWLNCYTALASEMIRASQAVPSSK